jgi:alanine racemase
LGIGLHGISAANKSLEPVATFKTHIAAIRQVKSSETIGYGRKGVLARDSRIAVILVGYADGLDRHLSCGVGEMYVKGHRVPIVGNICMDACMLDVTDYPDIQVGDQVEIFGKNVPVTEISDKLGTIPYEVLTRISRRVKRVFVKE